MGLNLKFVANFDADTFSVKESGATSVIHIDSGV